MRPNFVGQRKFPDCSPTIVISRYAVIRFVRISSKEIEDATPQFGRIALQVIEEISAKPIWRNIAFPSRHDHAGVRTQHEAATEQVTIDFLDIAYVERFDLVIMQFHGQV